MAGMAEVEGQFGVNEAWMVNYVANFHLLGILSPALRAQPFDRDVRVIMATCPAYIAAPSLKEADNEGVKTKSDAAARAEKKKGGGGGRQSKAKSASTPAQEVAQRVWTPSQAYARSKLALMTFGSAFQKHLDAYKRPDGLPTNARVIFVDPGWCRTEGMRSWLTGGSIWGLVLYLLAYLVPWLLLKSAAMGAQSFLHAAMDEHLVSPRKPGVKFVKECIEVDMARTDVADEDIAKQLWESTDQLVEEVEKELARRRARERADRDRQAEEEKQAEQVREIESLVNTIKKGKEKENASETTKPQDGKSRKQRKAA